MRVAEYPHDPKNPVCYSVETNLFLPLPIFGTGDNVLVSVQGSIAFGTVTQKLAVTGSKAKTPEWRYRIDGQTSTLTPTSAPFNSDEIDAFFQKGDFIIYKEVRKDIDPKLCVGVIKEPFAKTDFWSSELTLISMLKKKDSSSTVDVITTEITTKRSSHITKVV
jgi:hypothetical protein